MGESVGDECLAGSGEVGVLRVVCIAGIAQWGCGDAVFKLRSVVGLVFSSYTYHHHLLHRHDIHHHLLHHPLHHPRRQSTISDHEGGWGVASRLNPSCVTAVSDRFDAPALFWVGNEAVGGGR